MRKVVILGSGAAMGVPALGNGWNACNPNNPKNIRLRSATYIEYNNAKIIIDTGPDLRTQLLAQNIRSLDAVLYTHAHADHLHGIDDLREINRINSKSLNFYAGKETIKCIKYRFDYLIASPKHINNVMVRPSLIPNIVKPNHAFYIKNIKITPIKLKNHCPETLGYVFDDGEYVHIADFKALAMSAFKQITKRPKLMTIPLTTINGERQHASLQEVMETINKIKPERVLLNHMTNECDYDYLNSITPDYIEPAFDNLSIEF